VKLIIEIELPTWEDHHTRQRSLDPLFIDYVTSTLNRWLVSDITTTPREFTFKDRGKEIGQARLVE
jgi:hypothetical protein